MKYGLVIYKDTDNVGDDILSYAGCQYLPRVDYIIDRENLDTFAPKEKEYVATILNGWFLYNKFNWTPSEYLLPLFVGIHFSPVDYWGTQEEYLDQYGAEYLKTHEPIGCRDMATLRRMEDRGIEAYFSGCLTLTLEKFPDIQKENKIILVDIRREVCDYIIENTDIDVEIITHEQKDRGKAWEKRKKDVEDLLKKYQSAALVITTRLHCALPCLALGTKVLVIKREDHDFKERMSTFEQYFHHCLYEDIVQGKVDLSKIPENKEDFKILATELRERCECFINSCDKTNMPKLPEISEFVQFWNKKVEWQRTLLKRQTELHLEKILDEKKWLAEQYEQLVIELNWTREHSEELEKYVQELLKGKEYLEERVQKQEGYVQELLKGKEYLEDQVKGLTEILNDRWVRMIAEVRKKKEYIKGK